MRVNALEHERLPSLPDERPWAGYGNLFLLDRPELVQVRVSRSATQDEIAHVASAIAAKVRQGAVAVSPFIVAWRAGRGGGCCRGESGDRANNGGESCQ